MVTGFELEIAQCVANAPYALDIIFNCATEISERFRSSEIGFHLGHDWEYLRPILPFSIPETEVRLDVIDTLKPQFVNAGLDWEAVTADRIFADTELLQAIMLGVNEKMQAQAAAYAAFTPPAEQFQIARETMQRLGITPENYNELQIASKGIDFAAFEKLLATTDLSYKDFSLTQQQEARELLDSLSSRVD